jgi:hypothetical protein
MAKKKPAQAEKKSKAKKPKVSKHGEEIGSTEMLNRIRALKDEVRVDFTNFQLAKKEASDLKKEWETSVEKLLKLIDLSQEGSPLFDGIQTDDKGQANLETDDSWKDVRLSEIFAGLPPGLQQKVEDASLLTLSEITEWCKHKRLTDIPGVGQANATKLEEAIDAFWARRKEAAEQANGVVKATAAPLEEEPAKK